MRVRDLGCVKQVLGTKRFSALLRLTGVVLCACIILGISECTSKPTSKSHTPAFGTLAWGADDCVYLWVGYWTKQSTCRSYPVLGNTAVFDLYEDYDPQHRTQRVDLRAPGWIFVHDYSLNLDYKFPNEGSLSPAANQVGVLIFYEGRWLTQPEFEIEVKNADAAKHQAARDRAVNLQNQIDETKDRMIKLNLAPECNNSYNGCR